MSSSDHSGEKRRLTYDTEGDSEQDDTSDVLNDLGSDDQQSVEPTRGAGIGSDPSDAQGEGGEDGPLYPAILEAVLETPSAVSVARKSRD